MLYITYDTPTFKCSCLSTILKINAILAKWIKVKVYVNQQNFVSDIYNHRHAIDFLLSFLRELLMSIIILFTTWAFVLYRIYKSDTTRTPKCKVYLRYEWIYTFVFVENPRDRNDFRWEYRTKTFMYKSAEFCIRYIPLLIQHSFLLSFLHEYFDILDWYNWIFVH